jgi:hypothetical protein
MAQKLSDLRAKQKALKAEAEGLYAAAEKEQGGDLDAAQEARLAAITGEVAALDTEIDAAIAAIEPPADPKTPPASSSVADVDAETKRAADIVAACKLAGQSDKAAGFITDRKSLSEVVALLQAGRVEGSGTELHSGNPGKDRHKAAAGWDKAVARVNKRNGFN